MHLSLHRNARRRGRAGVVTNGVNCWCLCEAITSMTLTLVFGSGRTSPCRLCSALHHAGSSASGLVTYKCAQEDGCQLLHLIDPRVRHGGQLKKYMMHGTAKWTRTASDICVCVLLVSRRGICPKTRQQCLVIMISRREHSVHSIVGRVG